jgi:hypothetical protein
MIQVSGLAESIHATQSGNQAVAGRSTDRQDCSRRIYVLYRQAGLQQVTRFQVGLQTGRTAAGRSTDRQNSSRPVYRQTGQQVAYRRAGQQQEGLQTGRASADRFSDRQDRSSLVYCTVRQGSYNQVRRQATKLQHI